MDRRAFVRLLAAAPFAPAALRADDANALCRPGPRLAHVAPPGGPGQSELVIEEHYTDTAGYTDHVFALCHLLGFRFAPRIGDLGDKRLYVPDTGREFTEAGTSGRRQTQPKAD